MKIRYAIAVAALVGCGETATGEVSPPPPRAQLTMSSVPESVDAPEPEEEPALTVDPYEGWDSWCEPFDYERRCESAADCKDVPHPARRDLKCVHPWYSDNPEYRVCGPGFHRKERQWHRDRMREVIRQQYFGEVELCEEGVPTWKQHWRCQKAVKMGDKLATFFWVAYSRETTGRYWKRHRLDADVSAARTSWFKQADKYGWVIESDEHGEVVTIEPADEDEVLFNPHFEDRARWHFGLGPIGQNAALWTHWWDWNAPPEILCREVQPFEMYLRKAEDNMRKLRNGIRCGNVDGPYHEKKPTWTTLHRTVNMGRICPPSTKRHHKGIARFRKDARRMGLDPDEVVTPEMLGERIPREGQNERVDEIYAVLERKYPEIEQ